MDALTVIFQLAAFPVALITAIFNEIRSATNDYMLDNETRTLLQIMRLPGNTCLNPRVKNENAISAFYMSFLRDVLTRSQ